MDYKRADDPLFGKYCYIDTPWIAGKHTIYRIIRSGVHSNSWCEVPVNGQTEKVNHGEHSEEIVFVVLDTLIDENTKIMRFALKDVEIIEMADRKDEPTISKMEQVDKDINVRSKEPQTVVRLKHFKCPKCGRSDYIRSFEDWGIDGGIYKYKCINCNTYIKDEPQTCSFSDCDNFKNPDYARCIECKRKQIEPKDEPQTDCKVCLYRNIPKDSPLCMSCKNNSKFERDWFAEPQTDCAWKGEES